MTGELRQFIEHNRLLRSVMHYILRCTQRERVMLIVSGLMALACVFWLGAVEPAKASRVALEARLQQTAVNSAPASVTPQQAPQWLHELAQAMGMSVAALQAVPDDDSVNIHFQSVPMEGLLNWLAQVESNPMFLVEQLFVSPRDEPDHLPRTPAEHLVDAKLRVRIPVL